MSDAARTWQAVVGLCSICRSGRSQSSARESQFWRCLRAEREPAFARYPRLPVTSCRGFEAAGGTDPSAAG